jgi:hypothetical protein
MSDQVSKPKKLCEICNTNEATLNYPGFTYEWVCQYCHDQPSLWFPDKPARTPEAQRQLSEWMKEKTEKRVSPPYPKEGPPILRPALWTKEDEAYPVNKVVVDGVAYAGYRLRDIFRKELNKMPFSEQERIAKSMGSKWKERRQLPGGYQDKRGVHYDEYIDDIVIDNSGGPTGVERPAVYKDVINIILREPIKPETVEEHAEKWSREFEAAKAKAVEAPPTELPPEKPVEKVETPVKLVIEPTAQTSTAEGGLYSKGYSIWTYPKNVTITEETPPIFSTPLGNIGEVEEYVNRGREEIDLYQEQTGGERFWILMFLQRAGMASYPELASAFQKVEEDNWNEITNEERAKMNEAFEKAIEKEWIATWTPLDVEWKPEVLHDREIYHSKYSYDQLMAMNADEVKNIARVKGIPTKGRKDEIAQKIHSLDYGEKEAETKLQDIDKLLG